MIEMFSLQGKSAVVTGAAGGLGLGIAEVLVDAGAHVTLIDCDATKLSSALDGFTRRTSVRGETLDVTDEAALKLAFDAAEAAQGGIDIVFANAGISSGLPGATGWDGLPSEDGAVEALDLAGWDRTFDVNLKGVLLTIRQAARLMKARRRGKIIVTSSVTALRNQLSVGLPYPVSKAAVAHLTRNIALELAPFGITVNAIAPGTFLTDIADGGIRDEAVQAAIGRLVPLGRIAQVDEIKGLALYLASDASSYMTGSHISLDGGLAISPI